MKKTILYLSITSLLTMPNAIATEVPSRANDLSTNLFPLVELLQTFRAQNISLWEKIEAQELQQAMNGSLGDREREDLKRDLGIMTQEKSKEQASKEAQQNLVRVITQEQRETKELLDQVLEELVPHVDSPIPLTALHFTTEATSEEDIDETETPKEEAPKEKAKNKIGISPKETDKIKEMEQPTGNKTPQGGPQGMRAPSLSTDQQKLLFQRNLIGDGAWAALGGKNPSLSAKLCEAIQGWPGKTVDILYQDQCSFTLRVSGKKQDRPYKF